MRLATCKKGHSRESENLYKNGTCKTCQRDYREANREYNRDWNRKYYLRNAERFKADVRNRRLLRQYGIGTKEYEAMFSRQGGVCAICSNPQREGIKSLAVDHDHATKKVRGLLCRRCNRGIGIFEDRPDLLLAAIAYLKMHEKQLEVFNGYS